MLIIKEHHFTTSFWRQLAACALTFSVIAFHGCSSKDALPTPSNVAVINPSDSDGSIDANAEKQTETPSESADEVPVDSELVGPFNNDGPDSISQNFDDQEVIPTSGSSPEPSPNSNPSTEPSLQPDAQASANPSGESSTSPDPVLSSPAPNPSPSKPDLNPFQIPSNFPTYAHFQDSQSSNPSRISLLVRGRSLRLRFLCLYNERTWIPQIEDKDANPYKTGTPLPSTLNPSTSDLENSGQFRVSGISNRIEECTGAPYSVGQWRITGYQRNEITLSVPLKGGLTRSITLSNRTFVAGGLPLRNYHFTKADSTTRSTMREIIFESDKTTDVTSGLDGNLFQRVTCKVTSGPNAGKTVIFDSGKSRFHIRSNMLLIENPIHTDIDEAFYVADPYRPGSMRVERCTAPPFYADSYFVLNQATTSTGRTLLGLKLINDSWLREIGGTSQGSSRGYFYFEGYGTKD